MDVSSSAIQMQYATNVAKKAQDFVKLQGSAMLQLIDSAAAVSSATGAATSSGTQKGSTIDIMA